MKKVLKFLLNFTLVALTSVVLFSCAKDGKINHLSGIVRDDLGNPLQDVVVTSANVSVKTDENGVFCIEHISQVDNRFIVSFSHPNYFNVVRLFLVD